MIEERKNEFNQIISGKFFSFNFFLPFHNIIQMNKSLFFAFLFVLIAQKVSSQNTNPPQTPQLISGILGKGFDVAWSEFFQKSKRYNSTLPNMIAAAGFSNVRIRINQDYPNSTWLGNLSKQVNDSLSAQLIPIIAHQLGIIQTGVFNTTQEDIDYICESWGNLTTYFKGYSYKLLFNIWVQLSGKYGNNATAVNLIYSQVIKKIRSIDSYRIVIISPIKLSDPSYLKDLSYPIDSYLMIQWHFYAAGPTKDPKRPKYWINGDTKIQRDNILTSIQTAVDWMTTSGKKTWVGAWMAGNYNKGNNYTVEEQVGFASFMSRCLSLNNIPWSINTDDKFIDFDTKAWFLRTNDAAGIPVRDAILNPNQIKLYQSQIYGGKSFSFPSGYFDSAYLAGVQFTNVKSIMVPLDFRVTLFSQAGYTGSSVVYTSTTTTLNNFNVKSLRVQYLPKVF